MSIPGIGSRLRSPSSHSSSDRSATGGDAMCLPDQRNSALPDPRRALIIGKLGVDGGRQPGQFGDAGVGAVGQPPVQVCLGVGAVGAAVEQPQLLSGDPGSGQLLVGVSPASSPASSRCQERGLSWSRRSGRRIRYNGSSRWWCPVCSRFTVRPGLLARSGRSTGRVGLAGSGRSVRFGGLVAAWSAPRARPVRLRLAWRR